ncbi:MAG: adenosylcobinamide-phosphate synthase CbiB [Campylobacterota bacterium]
MHFELTLIAYLIDRVFGEFSFIKFYKHPVVFMGDFIAWYEKRFYGNSIMRGGVLSLLLVMIVLGLTLLIEYFITNVFITALIASTALASKSLYDSVKDILLNPHNIGNLVSRDTKELDLSGTYKAAIETYAENLSDGVVAPLLYLLVFGLPGVFIYKAINTLDSMVGYKNARYERFGKISATLDDVANYIPARITAVIIAALLLSRKALKRFYIYGKKHQSPNAGHPIAAMALGLNIALGGPTSYFGKVVQKPYFGTGSKEIDKNDLVRSLQLQKRFDVLVLLVLMIGVLCV